MTVRFPTAPGRRFVNRAGDVVMENDFGRGPRTFHLTDRVTGATVSISEEHLGFLVRDAKIAFPMDDEAMDRAAGAAYQASRDVHGLQTHPRDLKTQIVEWRAVAAAAIRTAVPGAPDLDPLLGKRAGNIEGLRAFLSAHAGGLFMFNDLDGTDTPFDGALIMHSEHERVLTPLPPEEGAEQDGDALPVASGTMMEYDTLDLTESGENEGRLEDSILQPGRKVILQRDGGDIDETIPLDGLDRVVADDDVLTLHYGREMRHILACGVAPEVANR